MRTLTSTLFLACILAGAAAAADSVKTANGILEGSGPDSNGVRAFLGVPFAQPPVGPLRWKEPQPPQHWDGVRQAVKFGPRCMQQPIFGDMNFRSNGMSEDCLYLNVWTPAKKGSERLPVLVYFYGGGFMAGDGSEPRYDGESLAARGIVSVTMSYRLNVFGFLALPELSKEAPYHGSGDYGLLDQTAALRWVKENIAAFGGDPARVTIAGESAGSASSCAQMTTPLAKGLFHAAIGESGSVLSTMPAVPLAKAEEQGLKAVEKLGAKSLAELRALPAEEVLKALGTGRFPITMDGYLFPEDPHAIFAKGEQSHVPLLVGWNSEEMNARAVLGKEAPTKANFEAAVRKLYPTHADEVLAVYSASDADVLDVATALASDRFIAYSTWKWADAQLQTGGKPVFVYHFERPRPAMTPEMGNAVAGLAGGVIRGGTAGAAPPPPAKGAVHSAEIEYALGNLGSNKVYAWTPDDYVVSKTMEKYFENFIKTGDPNGSGLPKWPPSVEGKLNILHIDVKTYAAPEQHRDRYLLIDKLSKEQ